MTSLSLSKSLGRAFEVLECFKRLRAPASTTDLNLMLGYPYSSLRAVVKGLVELGYLQFDETTHTYFPTQRVHELGTWLENSFVERWHLNEFVQALQIQLGETVAIMTDAYLFCRILSFSHSPEPMCLRIPSLGLGAVLTNSVTGRVLLSQTRDLNLPKLVADTKRWTKLARAVPVALERDIVNDIKFARTHDYLVGYEVWREGIGTVAYAIPSPVSDIRLAFSVSGPVQRIKHKRETICHTLQAAAAKIGATFTVRVATNDAQVSQAAE